MNFRTLKPAQQADLLRNLAIVLSGTEITAIHPSLRAKFVAAIGNLPDLLEAQDAEVMNALNERKAAVASRNDIRDKICGLLSQVRNYLDSGRAPAEQYAVAGFNVPNRTRTPFIPQDPTELWVTGFSNNVNVGRFVSNNPSGRANYEIWRRPAEGGAWQYHMNTRKRKFVDTPVRPGQHFEYRVRATSSRGASNYSNTAVIYGSG